MFGKTRGIFTLKQLKKEVNADRIDTVLIGFTDHYGRMMGKRLDAEFFLNSVAQNGSHACDYLLTVDMEMTPIAGYKLANWELGYGDFHLVPDFSTLRHASWLQKTALVLCDVQNEKTHQPVLQAPRSILQNQITAATENGYTAMAGSELEYYLFRDSYRNAAKNNYTKLEPFGWYIEDYHALQGAREESFNAVARRHLRDSGIEVESSKGEWGMGQHELNVRYADALKMADQHVVFKQCLKEIADQQEISLTFMAKFDQDQAGSSCHIHMSLWKDGKNAFVGDQMLGPVSCSDEFRWFLGGWIQHLPETMVFYAPTVNSYKRYQTGSWAPTRLAWSHDNRTASFRVVGHGAGLRIECRVAGADCNPYLAFAAAMASGMDGIANQTEPPPIFEGDVYAAKELPQVPQSLREAVTLFEKSSFNRDSFGPEVVEHYSHFYHTEQKAYDSAVTDWERKRYFEQI